MMTSELHQSVGKYLHDENQAPAIRIDCNGVWYYRDEPIEREYLVALFYTILNKQADGGYYLTTPVENVKIAVDDVPYSVISVSADTDGNLWCTLNILGSRVPINEEHPPRLSKESIVYLPLETPKGMQTEARFTRSAYLQFAEYLVQHDEQIYTFESFGQIFALEVP